MTDTAVFDRIATHEDDRRQGLASALMLALDGLAVQAGVPERLLSATQAGAALYTAPGSHHLAPYASAVRLSRRQHATKTASGSVPAN